ncbi:hypothetical protein MHY85_13420 [Cellulomonas sp. ACRRI]|uniref:hypothetical protein n=1 Tax=Cellulomonas sp. ACRRI TaxID=2918188 RepID=UPI001EF19F2E|nr:hypothetical protein [Cellulomonas sp. ACRRI]MCG7286969.1 hypothetical protein [Cellulomonas sp. ACRRI]
MTFDLSRALDEMADDAADRGRPADPDRVVGLRRRRRVVRRGAAGVAALAAAGALVLTGATLADLRSPEPLPAVPAPSPTAPTAEPTPEVTTPPEQPVAPDPVTPPATEEPSAGTRPLVDPYRTRWDGRASLVSDAPASGDGLEDGDFFGSVLAVDPGERTITVDLAVFYGGAAATAWAREHAPELLEDGMDLPPSGFEVVDDVQRSRTVALAPDAVVTGFCVRPDGVVEQHARDLAGLTGPGDAGCSATSRVDGAVGGASRFWVDVRGGEVVQLVGQYLS